MGRVNMRRSPTAGVHARTLVLFVAPLAALLTACSPSEPTPGSTPPSDEPSSEITSTTPDTPVDADLCTRLEQEALSTALPGIDFDDPLPTSGTAGSGNVEWTISGCRWESPERVVDVDVADASDFPSGFQCVKPVNRVAEVSELDGLGDTAWWVWNDFQGGEARVVACQAEHWVSVKIRGDRSGPLIDEAETRAAALVIARAVLPE
jgi:hypothetical protein